MKVDLPLLSLLVPTVLSHAVTSSDGFIDQLLAQDRNPFQEYLANNLLDCALSYIRTMREINVYLKRESAERVPPRSSVYMVPDELSSKIHSIIQECDKQMAAAPPKKTLRNLLLNFQQPRKTLDYETLQRR